MGCRPETIFLERTGNGPGLSCWNGGVPWCPECDRFLSPSSVTTTGECPRCGRPVDAGAGKAPPAVVASDATANTEADDELGPIPWHLKLLAGAIALYLGFRAWQGVEWIVNKF